MDLLTRYQRNRLQLIAGSLLAYGAFYFAGKFVGIPWFLGHEDSLLQHPHPVTALMTVAVIWLFSVAAATIIAARVRVHAGIFCAALGMMALSIRGGRMTDVLQQTDSNSIFILLLLELLILGGIVAAGFAMIRWLTKKNWLNANWDPTPPVEQNDSRGSSIAVALAFQLVIMLALVFLLLASDKKNQALIGIAVAAYVAAGLTRSGFAHVKLGYWPCVVPFVVGIIGYAIAFVHPTGLEIHRIDIPPARALPLDYASVGVAATCLGMWIGMGAEMAFDHHLFSKPNQTPSSAQS